MTDDKKKVEPLVGVRVSHAMRDAFYEACKNRDITASQAIRAFMLDYIKKHGDKSKLSS